MTYNFDQIIDRSGTGSIKYDAREKVFSKADVIPLWVADMDFATPDFILEAIKKRLNHPVLGYTMHSNKFGQAFINWVKKRHNWLVKPQWLTFSPGVVAALSLSTLALTDPGDEIIIQPPIYPPFFEVVKNLDRKLILNPLKKTPSGKYIMDLDDLQQKISPRTKLIFISNPHNPVGRVWTKKELESLAQICLKNNIYIISDDIHSDFVFSNYKYTPIATLSPDIANITITAMSPSKTFNIAGLSTSIVVIPNQQLLEKYNRKLRGVHIFLGNIFGDIAFQAAYENGEQWLEKLLSYLEQNIDFAVNYINSHIPKIKVFRPEGTFLLWLDFSNYNLSHEQIWKKLIFEANLGLNNGLDFGQQGEKHFRMNIATPRKILESALKNLEQTFA